MLEIYIQRKFRIKFHGDSVELKNPASVSISFNFLLLAKELSMALIDDSSYIYMSFFYFSINFWSKKAYFLCFYYFFCCTLINIIGPYMNHGIFLYFLFYTFYRLILRLSSLRPLSISSFSMNKSV